MVEEGQRTVLKVTGKSARTREVHAINACWSQKRLYYFANSSWEAEEPFIQFASGAVVSLKRAKTLSLKKWVLPGETLEGTPGRTLIVNVPEIRPLDWDWMRLTAAPLWYLQEVEKYDNVCIRETSQSISYLEDIAGVLPVRRFICFNEFEVRHLHASDEALASFRTGLLGKYGQPPAELVVVLRSGSAVFRVENLMELAAAVCPGCRVDDVVVDVMEAGDIIAKVSAAKLVVAPYSSALSQTLWANGTVVELIPKGTECNGWTFLPGKVGQVRHFRFAIGDQTELAGDIGIHCLDNVSALYNQTVSVSIDTVLAELANI
jgi:hypothetical protein